MGILEMQIEFVNNVICYALVVQVLLIALLVKLLSIYMKIPVFHHVL